MIAARLLSIGAFALKSSLVVIALACTSTFVFASKSAPLSVSIDAEDLSVISSLRGPLVIEREGSFFVGGHDITSHNLLYVPPKDVDPMLSDLSPLGTITVDQMYVRYQVPRHARAASVVFIHGCCLTGKTFETTPDGRMGWDDYFARAGYPTYVVDQSWRGRSAFDPSAINAVRQGTVGTDKLPWVSSRSHEDLWVDFRIGPSPGQAFDGERFPIGASAEFWKQTVPNFYASVATPNPSVAALAELTKKLANAILVSHSASGMFPFEVLNLHGVAAKVAAIVAVEPAACFPADSGVIPFAKIPVLIFFGDHTEEFPRWAARTRNCRAFVDALKSHGGNASYVSLAEVGMPGHSHMLMQDEGSLHIAQWMRHWMETNVTQAANRSH